MESREICGSIDGASVWSHHLEFAERASQLADHLDAALELAPGRVASAFALLRTAMEHACVDELLLLADRYREYTRVDEATFAVLQAEFEAGEADWTRNVVAFDRTRNGGSLVRTGHPVVDTDGNTVEQLSPYYPVLEPHDAILGPPESQSDLAEPFSDPDRLREWARRNRGLHQNYLQWRAIGDNLVLNGRLTGRESVQLDVHYRFLSAFAHATGTGYQLVDSGRANAFVRPKLAHLNTELVLLYAISIAIIELRAFAEFVDRRPKLLLVNRTELDVTVRSAAAATSYLWFPRIGAPEEYDFVEEANRRAFDSHNRRLLASSVDPLTIPPDELGYYRDPLKRLALLHSGGTEMSTGYGHRPLW